MKYQNEQPILICEKIHTYTLILTSLTQTNGQLRRMYIIYYSQATIVYNVLIVLKITFLYSSSNSGSRHRK